MTEIRFYHLQTQTPAQALPQILQKALGAGYRIVVRAPDEQAVEKLNEHLWTFAADSFLPHGSKKDGFAEDQPVWLTDCDENPNGATMLVLTEGISSEKTGDFALCCEIFDGHGAQAAREKWKIYKDQGHAITYWQQNDKGGWDKRI